MGDCEHKELKCMKCMRHGDPSWFNNEIHPLTEPQGKRLVEYYLNLKAYMKRLGFVEEEDQENGK